MEEHYLEQAFIKNFAFHDVKLLCAVSGGLDSVVLSHLLRKARLDFGIVHCNFKLREEASDNDAAFVEALSQKLDCPFFSIEFDTEKEAKEAQQSTQLVARELRYSFFEKIQKEENYKLILTAHHLNDSIETLLFNLSKGCGIRGLHGIPAFDEKRGIYRPLLNFSRAEIENYAKEKGLEWREDSSNSSDKYSRNFTRHHIIPAMKRLNPSLEETFKQNLKRFQDTEALYDFALEQMKKEICSEKDALLKINMRQLSVYPAKNTFLYEQLKGYGFNGDQCAQLLHSYDSGQSGKYFKSGEYTILLNRHEAELFRPSEMGGALRTKILATTENVIFGNYFFTLERLKKIPEKLKLPSTEAYLDYDKLIFPMEIRLWEEGDFFCPLGMGGRKKKLSDFFIDNKCSDLEKQSVPIFSVNANICWIAGMRPDERFKVDNNTQNVLHLKMEKYN